MGKFFLKNFFTPVERITRWGHRMVRYSTKAQVAPAITTPIVFCLPQCDEGPLDSARNAQQVCWLVLSDVCTSLSLGEGVVVQIVCPQGVGKQWKNALLVRVGQSCRCPQLLLLPPWRPRHCWCQQPSHEVSLSHKTVVV